MIVLYVRLTDFNVWLMILCVEQIWFRMCPEFASRHMDKDRPTAQRRQRSYLASSSRTVVRDERDRNRNIIERHKWDRGSSRTAHAEDHEKRCNTRHKVSSSDTERQPRSDECSRSSLQCRHKDRVGDKVLSTSDSYLRQDTRSDSITRRHADNYILRGHVSRDTSPYRDRSSHSRLSATTIRTWPAEEDHFIDTGTRHYTSETHSRKYTDSSRSNVEKESRQSKYSCTSEPHNRKNTYSSQSNDEKETRQSKYSCTSEPHSRKYTDLSRSNDEKESRQSKCSCTDSTNSRNRRTSGIRTSGRHSDEHMTHDCSLTARGYSDSNRRSRGELYEGVQRSRHDPAGCLDYKASCQATSEFSGSACKNSSDNKPLRTAVRNKDDDQINHPNVSSSGHSRTELKSRVNEQKSCNSDRQRSSPGRRHSVTRSDTVSVRKRHSYSDSRWSAGRDRTDRRNANKTNSASSRRKSASRECKRSRTHRETPPSCVHTDKSDSGFGERASESRVSLQCSSKEDQTSFESDVHHVSHTDEPAVTPAAAADDVDGSKQRLADSACGSTHAVLSDSAYCVSTSWPAAEGGVHQGSLAQSVLESDQHQQWIDFNSNTAAAAAGMHWDWHGSTVTSHHAVNDNTRLHVLVPATAITQLPLLSTKMSTVPAMIDPRKLVGMSAVSNANFSTIPSNASFNLAAVQPTTGSQYTVDNVYGDSPLLDEPMYYSYSPPPRDRSLNLVGSSASSVEYVHLPEQVAPMEDPELRKMLDVVNVAKTTLEQTLPPSCHNSDPFSLKQQKVGKSG